MPSESSSTPFLQAGTSGLAGDDKGSFAELAKQQLTSYVENLIASLGGRADYYRALAESTGSGATGSGVLPDLYGNLADFYESIIPSFDAVLTQIDGVSADLYGTSEWNQAIGDIRQQVDAVTQELGTFPGLGDGPGGGGEASGWTGGPFVPGTFVGAGSGLGSLGNPALEPTLTGLNSSSGSFSGSPAEAMTSEFIVDGDNAGIDLSQFGGLDAYANLVLPGSGPFGSPPGDAPADPVPGSLGTGGESVPPGGFLGVGSDPALDDPSSDWLTSDLSQFVANPGMLGNEELRDQIAGAGNFGVPANGASATMDWLGPILNGDAGAFGSTTVPQSSEPGIPTLTAASTFLPGT